MPKWASLAQFVQIARDAFALTLQKPRHRIGKGGVGQPVGTGGFDREQGAGHFVFTLCAAFKALVAVFYAPLQRLVVAGFEVQAIDAFQRTPIAAKGDAAGALGIDGDQAAGDRRPGRRLR